VLLDGPDDECFTYGYGAWTWHGRVVGMDGCGIEGLVVSAQLIPLAEPSGETGPADFPYGPIECITSNDGSFSQSASLSPIVDFLRCVPIDELECPDKWKAPELERVELAISVDGSEYLVTVPVNETTLFQEYASCVSNSLELGTIIIADHIGCSE